jgi:hypothetical protein
MFIILPGIGGQELASLTLSGKDFCDSLCRWHFAFFSMISYCLWSSSAGSQLRANLGSRSKICQLSKDGLHGVIFTFTRPKLDFWRVSYYVNAGLFTTNLAILRKNRGFSLTNTELVCLRMTSKNWSVDIFCVKLAGKTLPGPSNSG